MAVITIVINVFTLPVFAQLESLGGAADSFGASSGGGKSAAAAGGGSSLSSACSNGLNAATSVLAVASSGVQTINSGMQALKSIDSMSGQRGLQAGDTLQKAASGIGTSISFVNTALNMAKGACSSLGGGGNSGGGASQS